MKTLIKFSALAVVLAACSDDAKVTSDATPPMIDAPTTPKTFKQIEHLARPGINEALLFTNAFNAGYNATAPTFAGVDAATLAMVAGEAKTVLKALYLGVCLLNGAAGLTAATGLKPAGITCHAVGGALFTNGMLTGTTLTAESMTAAQAYADRVFAQFVPDVMRIDMSVSATTGTGIPNTSEYENACGDPAMPLPLLCGGRWLDDDTIDITYNYLINGVGTAVPAITSGSAAVYNQFSALVSDGVNFSAVTAQNKGNRTPNSAGGNPAQVHPAVNAAFPYSANPL